MKRFITFFAVMTVASASVFYPLNELGSYGINGDTSSVAQQEIHTPEGIVHGTYTNVDGEGQSQSVSYRDDGLTVDEDQEKSSEVVESAAENKDATNATKEEVTEDNSASPALPQPVPYTPEVAAARAAYFEARDQAIYLQQVAGYQQQLLNQPIFEYSPFFRDYYGAARHLRTVNPFYFLRK